MNWRILPSFQGFSFIYIVSASQGILRICDYYRVSAEMHDILLVYSALWLSVCFIHIILFELIS